MENLDTLQLALSVAVPGNELITDDLGRSSVMVKIPRQTLSQLGLCDSDEVHPAFLVNGREVDAIYISKYENVIEDDRAYSLPGKVPSVSMDFDAATAACTNKGPGWHLMTKVEWALLAQWCFHNQTLPLGNCKFGKDLSEIGYKAIPATRKDGQINLVYPGTGPLTWSHDRTPSGVWDLKGNLGEWVGGTRTVYGELQLLAGNDGADSTNAQTAYSSAWKAVDAATGRLITPDGQGTTPGSLKLSWANGVWTWTASAIQRTEKFFGCPYENITCDDTVHAEAKSVLQAYGFLKASETPGAYQGDFFYAHSGAPEKFFGCGGHYKHGIEAGIFCAHGTTGRADSSATRGFRSAYVSL